MGRMKQDRGKVNSISVPLEKLHIPLVFLRVGFGFERT
jgi:hypothetical protein